jgi:Lon-like ATP-dependent protease
MVQLAAGIAVTEQRKRIEVTDIEWVVNSSQMIPRPEKKIPLFPAVGYVNGLAVYGANLGMLLEIEVTCLEAQKAGDGKVNITGVVDEEELGGGTKTLRRRSMARNSVDNVITVLRKFGLEPNDYDLHVNFPGGIPIDGPSAGVAMATAIASAMMRIPVDHRIAMTGEVSIHGKIKPVGGIVAKVEAAAQAGVTKIYIPKENWQIIFNQIENLQVIAIEHIDEIFAALFQLERDTNAVYSNSLKQKATLASVALLHAEQSHVSS